MQTVLDINRLKPLGDKVIVKKAPEKDHKGFLFVPEEYRNDRNAQLFAGIVIAVGDRTRSANYGHDRSWFEPGDTVWFFNIYDFEDKEIVLKDETTGDEYLTIVESDVKAYELESQED